MAGGCQPGDSSRHRAGGVNITAHIFSTPAGKRRPIIWNYRLRDKSQSWKTGWATWGAEAANSTAIRSQARFFLFLGQLAHICAPLCMFLSFFLSPYARCVPSLCTWQKTLPHNTHMHRFSQLKYLIKMYWQILIFNPKFPRKSIWLAQVFILFEFCSSKK